MTTLPTRRLEPDTACILHWVFRRGSDTLTCAIEAGAQSFHVCTIPHGNLAAAAVEQFDAASSALRRHAEIASRLRDMGWVAHYGGSNSASLAA